MKETKQYKQESLIEFGKVEFYTPPHQSLLYSESNYDTNEKSTLLELFT